MSDQPVRTRLVLLLTTVSLIGAACGGGGTTTSPERSPGGSPAGTTTASTPGGADESPEDESPAATADESPAGGPDDSPSATSDGGPGGSPAGSPGGGGEVPGGFTGNIFAYGVTFAEGADEIATTRIEYYQELNPDVTMTFSESDYAQDQFLLAMDSGDPPDVLRVDRAQIAALAARDLLMPLDQCFTDMGVDPAATYYEGTLAQVTIDGQIYAAPEFLTTQNWFINQSAWSDAGLDPAAFNFGDWDALRSANEQLLQADGSVTRIGIDPKLPEFLPLWAKANGVDLISADGQTAQFDQPEVAEALQFAVDLINAHGGRDLFLDFRLTFNPFGVTNQWATDKVAAQPYEQFFYNSLLGLTTEGPNGELVWNTTPGEEGATPDPSVPPNNAVDLMFRPFVDRQGNPLTFATGQGLAVTAATDSPEAACAWVVTMTSAEAWVRAAQERKRIRDESGQANTGTYTANTVATERIFTEVIDVESLPAPFSEAVRVTLDNQANAFTLPPTPGAAAIFQGEDSIMAQAVARALDGEDIATVLADAQAEAQAAIDEANQ